MEVIVVLVVLAMITVLLERVTASSRSAQQFLSASSRATEVAQRIALRVTSLVESSRVIFQGDDVGRGYFAALDLARDPAAPGARIPIFEEARSLGPDEPGEPRTGNVLLFVREGDPVGCVADPSAGTIRDMTVHRFVCIYPRETTRRLVPSGPPARDLVLWRSVPFASHAELAEVADERMRANLVKDLFTRLGVDHAWDETAPADQAFYALGSDGSIAAAPDVAAHIAEDPMVSQRGRLVYRDAQLARSDASAIMRRPVLTADLATDWVPDGFEVKIGGAASSRMVWMRFVVEASAQGGQGLAVFAATTIANTAEY